MTTELTERRSATDSQAVLKGAFHVPHTLILTVPDPLAGTLGTQRGGYK